MSAVPLLKDEMISFLRDAAGELSDIASLQGRDEFGNQNDVYQVGKNAEALAKEIETRGVDSVIVEQFRHFAEDADQVAGRITISTWQLRIKVIAATAIQALRESNL